MDDRVKYWTDIADEDLSVAKHLIDGNKFLHTVFMCHQAVEKTLKAVIARDCGKGEVPPKTHNLSKLAIFANLLDQMTEEQQDFIDDLNPYNVEARYPEYKNRMAAALSKDICEKIISDTEGLLCWIKRRL